MITNNVVRLGGFAIVVAIDIKNAFNSIPWWVIHAELRRKGFPSYLRRIIDSYLSDRVIQYVGPDGKQHRKVVEAGVPQGSVLGPILWNIAFDGVLELAEGEEQVEILCYADDTLIVATGRDIVHTRLRAGVFATRVVNHIESLGLRVAANKTEAILFHPRSDQELPATTAIGDMLITFRPSIKYLGIMVDDRWKFGDHIRYVDQKASKVIRALNRLMPNLRGPYEKRRRLYASVVMSVILYGAPIWGDALAPSRMAGVLNAYLNVRWLNA